MDDEPLAGEKLRELERVIKYLKQENYDEQLSYSETVIIDGMYDMIKEYV